MGTERWFGLMGRYTKENGKMELRKDLVLIRNVPFLKKIFKFDFLVTQKGKKYFDPMMKTFLKKDPLSTMSLDILQLAKCKINSDQG
jgi:hypothetical protein